MAKLLALGGVVGGRERLPRHARRLRLRRGVRRRAQVPRDAAVLDRAGLEQPRARLRRPARARHAALLLMSDLDRVAEEIRRWGYAEPGFAIGTSATGLARRRCCWTCCPGSPAADGRGSSSTSAAARACRRGSGRSMRTRSSESSRSPRCGRSQPPPPTPRTSPTSRRPPTQPASTKGAPTSSPAPNRSSGWRPSRPWPRSPASCAGAESLPPTSTAGCCSRARRRRRRSRTCSSGRTDCERSADSTRARRSRWPVSRERLEESGRFRFTAETTVHGLEHGNADRLVGFVLSEGSTTTLLEAGVTEKELGLAPAARGRSNRPRQRADAVVPGLPRDSRLAVISL